jgi:protein-disulfide isomerase
MAPPEDELAKKTRTSPARNANQTPLAVYLVIAVVAVLVVIAVIRAGQPEAVTGADAGPGIPAGVERGLTEDGLPYLGSLEAPIEIIEYEDFGCHNCKAFAEQFEPDLILNYVAAGKVRLVSYPVAFVNAQSVPSAEAAECALAQGKYWEYRHVLFLNQGTVSFTRDNLVDFAGMAGLNLQDFSSCYDQGQYRPLVRQRTSDSQRLGVTGTPSFDINGKRYQGVRPYDSSDPANPGFVQILTPLLGNLAP